MTRSHGGPSSRPIEFIRGTDDRLASFYEQRGHQVLEKLIASYLDHEKELKEADETLRDDPNYATAMHASASALKSGKINVFISYRTKVDNDAAEKIARVFRIFSAGKVDVTLEADFPTDIVGRKYREEIENAIKRSHWFILLLSDPKQISEWCMYETGMFRASMISKKINRLVCICQPDAKPPDPIEGFQAVPATPEKIEEFLNGLFRKDQPLPGWHALNTEVDNDLIREEARKIASAISSPTKPIGFNYRVALEINEPLNLCSREDLDRSRVNTNSKTADIFGKVEKPETWGQLIENVRLGTGNNQWISELYEIVKKACRGNTFRPISGTFESSHGGRILRPVLESMEQNGHVCRFNLLFVEDYSTTPAQIAPPVIMAFLIAFRANIRIRWEVVERFKDVRWDDSQIDVCAGIFSRIEREGQSFSQWDIDLLCTNYSETAGLEIRRIMQRWCQMRHTGQSATSDGHGELDSAFALHDHKKVETLLKECAQLNRDFFRSSYPILEDMNNF